MQPAILPMPQPHSQSRSLSACMTVTFCGAVRPARLNVVTAARSAAFVQPVRELALGLVDLGRHLGAGRRPCRATAAVSAAAAPSRRGRRPRDRPGSRPRGPVSSGQMIAITEVPRPEPESFAPWCGAYTTSGPGTRGCVTGRAARPRRAALERASATPLRRRLRLRLLRDVAVAEVELAGEHGVDHVVDRLEVAVSPQLLTLELLEGPVDALIGEFPWASSFSAWWMSFR